MPAPETIERAAPIAIAVALRFNTVPKVTIHVISKKKSPAGRKCGPFLTVPNPNVKRHAGSTWKGL
jgi:hypothetical protein